MQVFSFQKTGSCDPKPLGMLCLLAASEPILTSILYTLRQAVVLTALCTLSSAVLAQESGADRPELGREERHAKLNMMVAQMRKNYEVLRTVSGEYAFSDAFRFDGQIPGLAPGDQVPIEPVTNPALDNLISPPAGYEEKRHNNKRPNGDGEAEESLPGHWSVGRGVISYSFDCVGDRFHVFYEPRQPVTFNEIATGRWYQWTTNGDLIHWMLTPEHFIEFDIKNTYGQLPEFPPAPSVGPFGGRVVLRQPPRRHLANFIHFRDFFSGGHRQHYEYINIFCDDIGIEFVKLLGPPDDSPGIYTFIKGSSHGPVIMDLDESVGFNVVRYQKVNESGRLMVQQDLSYKKVDGIFLPARYRGTRNSETHPESVRQFDLLSATINKPIDDAEFGFEQFNLKYGERMHDQIENTLSFYDGEKFVDSKSFVVDKGKLDWRITPDGPIRVTPASMMPAVMMPAMVPPGTQPGERPSSFRMLLIGLNILAIIVIAVFVLRQKR
jgi:hypothetical protein